MSTLTSRISTVFALVIVCLSLAFGHSKHHSPKRLTEEQLIRALDCITRKLPGMPLDSRYSGPTYYRVRYIFGAVTIGEETYSDQSLILAVYARNGRYAALYEMYVDKEQGCEKFIVANTATLRKNRKGWYVQETGGGVYTINRVQKLVELISKTEDVHIPRSKVTSTCAKCEFGSLY